jgi:hypothetical protein
MPLHKANKNKIKTLVTRSLNIIATRSLNIVATRSLNIIATRSLNIIATSLAPIANPLASIATRSIHSQTPIREKSQTANFQQSKREEASTAKIATGVKTLQNQRVFWILIKGWFNYLNAMQPICSLLKRGTTDSLYKSNATNCSLYKCGEWLRSPMRRRSVASHL